MKTGPIITGGLLVVSAIVCTPIALLTLAFLFYAPDRAPRPLEFLYPSLLIIGTWIGVALLWRAQRWISACVLLAILIGVYLYWWSTLELP